MKGEFEKDEKTTQRHAFRRNLQSPNENVSDGSLVKLVLLGSMNFKEDSIC